MLLNGKDIDRFMTDHPPVIHGIMCKAVRDEQLGSLANYNTMFGTQLQEVLQQREQAVQARMDNLMPRLPPPNPHMTIDQITFPDTMPNSTPCEW